MPTPALAFLPSAARSTPCEPRKSIPGVACGSSPVLRARPAWHRTDAKALLAGGMLWGLGAAAASTSSGSRRKRCDCSVRKASSSADECSAKDYIMREELLVFSVPNNKYCSDAIRALKKEGYNPTIVECETGTPMRLEIGGIFGTMHLPKVFIKGNFVGSCNDGGMGGVLPNLENGKIQELMSGKANNSIAGFYNDFSALIEENLEGEIKIYMKGRSKQHLTKAEGQRKETKGDTVTGEVEFEDEKQTFTFEFDGTNLKWSNETTWVKTPYTPK
eukprot:TRINITY_DN43997_c0_g1_i1.p1 TRINITY_DN43997_c0_g1~~TRINITY_DN43997_c0_g1_i1.p1  ORF type:complete len:284 (-),score=63.96 TRINITY_DN43997_c0_g1_i1:7-831(-)